MQRPLEIIPNYFQVLEIEPTRDLDTIQQAFKKLMLKYHTDRGGDKDRAQAIVEAREALLDTYKREKCYQAHAKNPIPNAVPLREPEEIRNPPPESIDPTAMTPHGVRVTVYIPLYVSTKKWYEGEEEAFQNDPEPQRHMSYRNFIDPKKIDFKKIADKLTAESQAFSMQVGVNVREVFDIVHLHSYYKHSIGAYAVRVEVLLTDVEARESEESRSSALNARPGEYFWLRQGTRISEFDVKSITKSIMSYLSVYVPGQGMLPLVEHADRKTIQEATLKHQSAIQNAALVSLKPAPRITQSEESKVVEKILAPLRTYAFPSLFSTSYFMRQNLEAARTLITRIETAKDIEAVGSLLNKEVVDMLSNLPREELARSGYYKALTEAHNVYLGNSNEMGRRSNLITHNNI